MADSSFDVVSKVDRQEVDNALNQAAKELSTRFDFRGTDTTIDADALADVLNPKPAFVEVTTLWLEKVPACL